MQVLPKNWWWNSLFLFIGNIQISYAQLSLINDGSFEDTIAGWQNNAGKGTLLNWFASDSIYSGSTASKMPWCIFA